MTGLDGGAREELEIFPWDANFETGLEPVDAQHKRLVGLLNELVCSMSGQSGRKDPEGLPRALAELREYALTHFACEEKIWSEGFGAGDEWVAGHERSHGDFCAKIEAMAQSEGFRKGLQGAVRGGKSLEAAKKEAKEQMAGSARVMIDAMTS